MNSKLPTRAMYAGIITGVITWFALFTAQTPTLQANTPDWPLPLSLIAMAALILTFPVLPFAGGLLFHYLATAYLKCKNKSKLSPE